MTREVPPESLWTGEPDDVITGVVDDRAYAIPRRLIRRAVERDSALAAAGTFGDVRAVRAAGHDVPDVDEAVWVEYLVEDGVVAEGERIPDDTPFDVDAHPAYCESQYCSTLEQGTSNFLSASLKARFGHPDTRWGIDYEAAEVVLQAGWCRGHRPRLRARDLQLGEQVGRSLRAPPRGGDPRLGQPHRTASTTARPAPRWRGSPLRTVRRGRPDQRMGGAGSAGDLEGEINDVNASSRFGWVYW